MQQLQAGWLAEPLLPVEPANVRQQAELPFPLLETEDTEKQIDLSLKMLGEKKENNYCSSNKTNSVTFRLNIPESWPVLSQTVCELLGGHMLVPDWLEQPPENRKLQHRHHSKLC